MLYLRGGYIYAVEPTKHPFTKTESLSISVPIYNFACLPTIEAGTSKSFLYHTTPFTSIPFVLQLPGTCIVDQSESSTSVAIHLPAPLSLLTNRKLSNASLSMSNCGNSFRCSWLIQLSMAEPPRLETSIPTGTLYF